MKRLLLALLAALLLAGCGEERGQGEGTASLWITRDRGDEVVLTESVPAGLTAMQALRREAEVETRFGGRFVQSIDGIEGSRSGRRDWFYFVNGIEADRGATEYRLRAGDVLWWDFHSWSGPGRARVWVGAFPEPFLHGYDGKRRPAAVRYDPPLQTGVRELARLIGSKSVARAGTPIPDGASVLYVHANGPSSGFHARFCEEGDSAGDPVCFVLRGQPDLLSHRPNQVRFQDQVVPWP